MLFGRQAARNCSKDMIDVKLSNDRWQPTDVAKEIGLTTEGIT